MLGWYDKYMTIPEFMTYLVIFLALYVQVFFLVTYLEHRKELRALKNEPIPDIGPNPPKVAIIVPCWNEEKTVHGTIASILALQYPEDKLEVIAVDDGSTDTTWQELLQYKDHPRVRIFQKENGGKHTAINFGIDNTDADIIGGLDADSFVAPDALIRMIGMFQRSPETMAVTPSLIVNKPKNLLQWAQSIEYNMSTYNKKMLSLLGAIHVTPGPFSLFRKEVFAEIGKFRKAHNTEDQEYAYRMQENYKKIEHSVNSFVYTNAPDTVKKLYKQRVRWVYGFIQNTIDYKRLIFNRKYLNFSFFTLPSGVVSIIAVVYIALVFTYDAILFIIKKITQYSVAGFGHQSIAFVHLNWFYINTAAISFVTIFLYGMLIVAIVIGARMNKQGSGFSWHILSYMLIYSVIAPFWLLKAAWNTIARRGQPAWR
jgi:cellulose synthase/poly-beta-1,6-N-acetylglucosamine synthase-like glycosyltransferase